MQRFRKGLLGDVELRGRLLGTFGFHLLARFGEFFVSEPVWTQALLNSVIVAVGAAMLGGWVGYRSEALVEFFTG